MGYLRTKAAQQCSLYACDSTFTRPHRSELYWTRKQKQLCFRSFDFCEKEIARLAGVYSFLGTISCSISSPMI
jgi:hypothetical protein